MLPLYFGLGNIQIVESIEILWPGGSVQTLTDVAVNQKLPVVESP